MYFLLAHSPVLGSDCSWSGSSWKGDSNNNSPGQARRNSHFVQLS